MELEAAIGMPGPLGRTWWSGSLVKDGGGDGIKLIRKSVLHSLISWKWALNPGVENAEVSAAMRVAVEAT